MNTPADIANYLGEISDRLIDFNDALGLIETSKFDALRLHLAPQKLASWGLLTAGEKNDKLDTLLTFLSDARSLLDTSGYQAMPLFADITHDWDVLSNHLYLVHFSTDLNNPKQGREVARFRTLRSEPERMEIPLQIQGDRGFWTIERIQD